MQAWQTVRMYIDARSKDGLKPFAAYIGQRRILQSPAEMRDAITTLAKQFGGRLHHAR